MVDHPRFVFGVPLALLSLLACSGKVAGDPASATGPADTDAGSRPASVDVPSATDKLDLLFVVDNSASMGDKQTLLRRAIPDLVARLVRPRCLDIQGKAIGRANLAGVCDVGRVEFLPLRDLHLGFVSSSLGARGGDQCAARESGRHNDDRAHLLDRVPAPSQPVTQTLPHHFLAWLPDVPQNDGKSRDPEVVGATPIADADTFASAAQRLLDGIGEDGCGYEAPLEAAYRFLVQPDPYAEIVKDGDMSRFDGDDFDLLAQRKAFLRPDSAVAIVLVTDEDESNVAPTMFGGRSWFFTDSMPLRPGTTACTLDPASPSCTSCYMTAASGDAACTSPLDMEDDHPNLRFFDMKRRFGVDPTYPLQRYVSGFQDVTVPARDDEVTDGVYVGTRRCTSPLFAATLPSKQGDELCALPRGPRSPGNVYFAVLGGVPWQLLTERPDDLSEENDAPYKAGLDQGDWSRVLGGHPLMKQSWQPRAGASRDGAHGREWDTGKRDLQYACTFPLAEPIDCTIPARRDSCDCSEPTDSPVCDGTQQLRAKAYPSLRALSVAHQLGRRGVVGSICPRETIDETSPQFGYRPVLDTLVDRMSPSFAKP